jgi:ATP-dependent Zn protease
MVMTMILVGSQTFFSFLFCCSGRLDKMLYVPLPTPDDRVAILKALATGVKLSADVDFGAIGRSERADGYSGADCAALLREAGLAVLKESVVEAEPEFLSISAVHFDYAFNHVVPSVSKKDQARYDRMRNRIAHARSRGAVMSEIAVEESVDAHIESTFEASTTAAVLMAGDTSQLSNVSEKERGEIVDAKDETTDT